MIKNWEAEKLKSWTWIVVVG